MTVTIDEILGRFNGRQLDGQGLLISEINGAIAAEEHAARQAGEFLKLPRVLGFDDHKAVLSKLPELGAQPWDAKSSRDSDTSRARLGDGQDAERSSRAADSALVKFSRIWRDPSDDDE